MIDFVEYARFLLSGKGDAICTGRSDSVFSLDYGKLRGNGIKLLIFDADETICPDGGKLPAETLALFRKLVGRGFRLAILSNCGGRRRGELRKMLHPIPVIVGETSSKPNRAGFVRITERAGIPPGKSAMIGDKLGVDIWGAYVSGIGERILVRKYSLLSRGKGNGKEKVL